MHVLEDVGKEAADVLADGHVRNNTLDRILALVPVLAIQVSAQLEVFAWDCERAQLGGWALVPFFGAARGGRPFMSNLVLREVEHV